MSVTQLSAERGCLPDPGQHQRMENFMVYRVYVEKKPELANEAAALKSDARTLLGIKGLENVRIINRYDAENIDAELFDDCIYKVFA